MKILFLHGWHSVVGGVKPTFLANARHEVINPALDDDDFDAAVRTAQAEYDQHQPDVIVGSSRGGAVAMNIDSKETPLVLLCPAWKNWGTVKTIKPNSVILHSRKDDVIPFADSEELVANSGLPPERLIEVGDDHRLADPVSLSVMLEACERLTAFRAKTPKSLAEFTDALKSYMRNQVCGIVFAESNGDKRPSFEIGSGFIIEAEGLYVLVTAGHVMQKLDEIRKKGRLIGASLIVPSGPKSMAELSLFDSDLATAKYSESLNLDIAFMCIAPDLVNELRTAGLNLVKRDCIGPPNAKRAKRILVGFGADGARLHDEEMFVTVENNSIRPRYRTSLGALPFKLIGLRDWTTDDDINFHARPESEETKSLAGMSGGVVIDLFDHAAIRDYALVGVQSTQHTVSKRGLEVVTKVKFTSGPVVLTMVDEYAKDFLENLRRNYNE